MVTQATRSILIENAMYRTLLATCGSTEMKCINKVSLNCEASCLWCHQESNWDTRLLSRKNAPQRLRGFFVCDATRNRTGDTRLNFYAQSFALSIKTPRRELRGFFVCGATRNRTGDTRLNFYAQSFALSIKTPRRDSEAFLRWCHQESNRGHKDFQSFALPTELWHQFLFASANLRVILILAKRRAVFLRFLGKRGWLAAELAAESSAVAGFPAV